MHVLLRSLWNIKEYLLHIKLNDINNANSIIISLISRICNLHFSGIETNSFITILQYQGICWFIAFLTCICYSDKSKNLLLSKQRVNIPNICDINTLLTSFTTLVYYIIDNITKKLPIFFLIYNEFVSEQSTRSTSSFN
jgi:hypothetical protein